MQHKHTKRLRGRFSEKNLRSSAFKSLSAVTIIRGQLNTKVEEIIKVVDAKSLRDMSKVMKVIKENLNGKCDMQVASNLVKSKLSE